MASSSTSTSRRDGVVVVHHDDTLDRTTDAHGPISARTADELARVDAGYSFSPNAGAASADVSLSRTGDRRSPITRRARTSPVRRASSSSSRRPRPTWRDERSTRLSAAGVVDRVVLGSFHGRALARSAPLRAANSHRRRTRGDALGALSLPGAVAARPDEVSGAAGPRASRRDRHRHAAASSPTRTAPACPCASGLSTRARTWSGCWTGAPTASSATARMSRWRWCGSGFTERASNGIKTENEARTAWAGCTLRLRSVPV